MICSCHLPLPSAKEFPADLKIEIKNTGRGFIYIFPAKEERVEDALFLTDPRPGCVTLRSDGTNFWKWSNWISSPSHRPTQNSNLKFRTFRKWAPAIPTSKSKSPRPPIPKRDADGWRVEEGRRGSGEAEKALKKEGEQTEGVLKKKKDLKDAPQGLALEMPTLAKGLRFFIDPITLGFAALSVSVGAFVQKYRELKQAQEATPWEGVINGGTRQAEALEQQKNAVENVEKAYKNSKRPAMNTATRLKRKQPLSGSKLSGLKSCR
jgi:hypothetical protein